MLASQNSTFHEALPYAVATLATGTVGAVIAFSASSTAIVVAGVALALIGAMSFYGVVMCGVIHSGNPEGFRENVGKSILTSAGSALAEIISTVAREVLINLISGRGSARA